MAMEAIQKITQLEREAAQLRDSAAAESRQRVQTAQREAQRLVEQAKQQAENQIRELMTRAEEQAAQLSQEKLVQTKQNCEEMKRQAQSRLKQAAAAVGQSELMNVYGRFFGEYGHTVAQLLLTRDVVDTPEKKQNVTNTFETLLKLGAIPIVNENDTVSTYELEHVTAFGDNDTLAAVCAQLISADLLILLSDIDGLYDADPRTHEEARRIPVVYRIDY